MTPPRLGLSIKRCYMDNPVDIDSESTFSALPDFSSFVTKSPVPPFELQIPTRAKFLPRLSCSNQTRGSLRCKFPPPVAGWFRSARQAPATRPQARPGSAGQIPRQLPSEISGVSEVPADAAALGWLTQAPSAAENPLPASPQWSRCPARSAPPAIARCIQPGVGRGSSCDASQSSPFLPPPRWIPLTDNAR